MFKSLESGNYEPIYFCDFKTNIISKALNDEHKFLLLLSYITGARPSELYTLKKEDFNFMNKGYMIVNLKTTKRGVNRKLWIPISDVLFSDFKKYVVNKLVFPRESVFPSYFKAKNFRGKFFHDNRRAGIGVYNDDGVFIPLSFYIFRHNILSLLAEAGADYVDLQIFKGAKLSKQLYGSSVYYIHRSAKSYKKLASLLRKIIKCKI